MAVKSKKQKLDSRTKKKLKLRKRISGVQEKPRLSVFRSEKHTYAQLVSDTTGVTIASASTAEKEVRDQIAQALQSFEAKFGKGDGAEEGKATLARKLVVGSSRSSKSIAAALAVGTVLAERAKEKDVRNAVFDRNGYVYHGRVQAVAEAARLAGLDF